MATIGRPPLVTPNEMATKRVIACLRLEAAMSAAIQQGDLLGAFARDWAAYAPEVIPSNQQFRRLAPEVLPWR
ncbi:MAG: hypothetical protein DMG35_11085 [Acidobacteria bacterium]|nr:MAG: hypothetical protein AUH86_04010 [Acidobacteria bacterium 13_1_40CM_4_58_4]PYT60468.1 MAG: hypothetical protein DMG35_11085 [Acidobacteriota bacterium]